jgi:ATP adenylyltransferase/5',5'''-P-1,P-4-tetraphosphate phosphorylase II
VTEATYLNYLSFENIVDFKSNNFDLLLESFKVLDTDKIIARRSFTQQLQH